MLAVLCWWCLAILDYIVLYSIVLHLTLVRNVDNFPILVWQQWTKYWIKVVTLGDSVHTKVLGKSLKWLNHALKTVQRVSTTLTIQSFKQLFVSKTVMVYTQSIIIKSKVVSVCAKAVLVCLKQMQADAFIVSC